MKKYIFTALFTLHTFLYAQIHTEQIHSEMMAHVPLLAHGSPQRVLILGNDNHTLLNEVCKHETIQHIVIVHPKAVPSAHPHTTTITQEPLAFLSACQEKFDVIICDTPLQSPDFFKECKILLRKNGILVSTCTESLQPLIENRQPFFKYGSFYLSPELQAISWASDRKYRPSETTLADRASKIKERFYYYTPAIHKASFTLPAFIKEKIEK